MMTENKCIVDVCTVLQKASLKTGICPHGIYKRSFKSLAPVPDRAACTAALGNCCWAAYSDLNTRCFTETVSPHITFVDLRTGAHTNKLDCMWLHTKAFLNPNNRKGKYI